MVTTTRPVPKVAVEESKAQRIQRQQARFRDRGGTFIPSDKNPLADILLARTVTGESPSKAKSLHSSKTERLLPTASPVRRTAVLSPSRDSSNAARPKGTGSLSEKTFQENSSVPGSSKAAKRVVESVRKKGSKKRKTTHVEDISADENEESKPSRKPKARRPKKSAQDNIATPKRKARTTAVPVVKKGAVESEDEQTLVEAPQKAGSRGKKRKSVVIEDTYDMSGDDHPATTRKRVSRLQKTFEKFPSSRRTLESTRKESEGDQLEVTCESSTSKRRPPDSDTARKKSEKTPRSTSNSRKAGDAEVEFKKPPKGKTSVLPQEDATEQPVVKKRDKGRVPKVEGSVGNELDDDVFRPRKRKKAVPVQENQDDRPLEVEEIESKLLPSSKLKENTVRAPSTNPKAKPTSRKPSKGPPPDLLERIKTIATNHRPVDDEPDPLDCLS
ncbi:hypothetical protein PISMIDRAFT_15003 [Pisolithus microcarpus 441]|uniref:Uncharacterized protein n=1 Tax=Pisolithus microcarpus 441 TaxID=765257 RepID=A0A0C9YU56_9AGAM|nr:hypothetical protein PISMIDRAFT_15003 [Pisolithus microcarpus 441]